MKTVVLSLLIYASLVCAQTWEWEQYTGTFWHQTPDQIPWLEAVYPWEAGFGNIVVGDFNANGRDEIIRFRYDGFYQLIETDDPGNLFSWSLTQRPFGWVEPNETLVYAQAVNLDQDPNDEILFYTRLTNLPTVYSVRCFDPDTSRFPQFTERPDIIDSLDFPGFPLPSLLGNFDGDGLLDGFAFTGSSIEYYERESGAWMMRENLEPQPYLGDQLLLAADIDNDGDMEIGFYEPGVDCNCMFGYIFDYVEGEGPVVTYSGDVLLYPGDYDGDGNAESFVEGFELSLPSRLVRLSAGDPYTSTEIANQWEVNSHAVFSSTTNGENHVYSFYNGYRFQFGAWIMVPAGYLMRWSDSTWVKAGDGWGYGQIYSGNTADMNGDGNREYIYEMLAADLWGGGERMVWSMGSGDYSRFFDNPDTVFTAPRIGDVEGDGAGELVTRVTDGAPPGLYFYELERVGTETIATYKPELSEGLPTEMFEYTLADIDNDGHAEIFVFTNSDGWRSFFWRNNHWVEYTGILPPEIGLFLYFADFDGDGDLDVFTQDGLWISLSPSPVNDEPILHPSSFILSAYPNPFNPETTLQFDLPLTGLATLKIYDVLGREVETLLDENMTAGTHVVHYDAAHLSSGVFFARLESNHNLITRKLLLLK
ncbi:MAG: T9SS type A sorting domain-containing protein [Calditrichaeota bacterium]|nr:T9SS type A sorting domain-containing protein [Calditrichota bacterium]MCB9369203.1 T9SS type A sorting domain-containing protein [Calditrichota bacterium]